MISASHAAPVAVRPRPGLSRPPGCTGLSSWSRVGDVINRAVPNRGRIWEDYRTGRGASAAGRDAMEHLLDTLGLADTVRAADNCLSAAAKRLADPRDIAIDPADLLVSAADGRIHGGPMWAATARTPTNRGAADAA